VIELTAKSGKWAELIAYPTCGYLCGIKSCAQVVFCVLLVPESKPRFLSCYESALVGSFWMFQCTYFRSCKNQFQTLLAVHSPATLTSGMLDQE